MDAKLDREVDVDAVDMMDREEEGAVSRRLCLSRNTVQPTALPRCLVLLDR